MQNALELTGSMYTTPLAADSSSSPTPSISKRGKGREMISEACLVPCCSSGRDEFFDKMDDQCGSGCSEEIVCGIDRCNGYKICVFLILVGGIGIFLLPLFMLFSVLYDRHCGSCGAACCDDDFTCCIKICWCKGLWTLLIWICAVFLIEYTMHGPYIFGSICGAYFMQHHYNLSTKIYPDSVPPTELPFSSTLLPYQTSPPISPTTQNPFTILSGSCTKNYTESHGTKIHCIQSPNYPGHYPSAESCRIGIERFERGDSLTATDFASRVDDTLQLRWTNYFVSKCGNEGIMSSTGDAKYDPRASYDIYGYLNFSGLVGGPCNFTCTSLTRLYVDWKPAAKPTNSIIPAKGWKLCYEPARVTAFGSRTESNLQCAAPSLVCAAEFYVVLLWASYVGAGFLFLISLFVCYCGRSLGACLDAWCLFNCGVARCCCDVCFNACLRADVVAEGREKAIQARVRAQHAAYNKDLQDIKLLPFIGPSVDAVAPPDLCGWRCFLCWHKCIKYVDCCFVGHCKPPCRLQHYTRCCCGVCCRLFCCMLAFVAFAVSFGVGPACVAMVNVTDTSANATGRSVPHEVLVAVGTGGCKYLTTGVLALMAVLACCVLALLLVIQLHGTIRQKCVSARHSRLRKRNGALKVVSDAASAADFEQALQTLAVQSIQFPDDPVLASCADLIREKSAEHAHVIAEARKAISAHDFVVAVQQASKAVTMCPADEESMNVKQQAKNKLDRVESYISNVQRHLRCGEFAQAIAQVEEVFLAYPQNGPLRECKQILANAQPKYEALTAAAAKSLETGPYPNVIDNVSAAAQLCRKTDSLVAQNAQKPRPLPVGDPIVSIPILVSMRDQAWTKLRGRDNAVADAKKLIKRALFAEASQKIETGLKCYPDDLQLTQLRETASQTAGKYNPIFEKASSLLEAGRLQYVDRELSAARAICTESEGVRKLKEELAAKNRQRDAFVRAAMQYAEAAEFSRAKEHIETALTNFPGDAVLESRRQDVVAKADRFPSMVAKAEQLVLEANFSGAIRTANAALNLCKKAAPALDALSNAKQKARMFPPLQSAANRLYSDGHDFAGAKSKVNEALAVCPQSQRMLKLLAEIEKANRLFKAVLARHSFDKLEVGGTVFVLLESHVPPTVFFASVTQLNFVRQTISVAFPDLKGVEHEFDVSKFARLVKKQNHPVVSSPPPMTPAHPPSHPTPAKRPIPSSAVLPQPAPTHTARTPPAVAAASAHVTTQSLPAVPRTAMSLYASRIMDIPEQSSASKLGPISGIMAVELVTLDAAMKRLVPKYGLSAVNTAVYFGYDRADNILQDCADARGVDSVSTDANGLNRDQIAAINIYTQQLLYKDLNDLLRHEDRSKLLEYFSYLKLLLTALEALPDIQFTVYRGIKADVKKQYRTGRKVKWWAFSSCTTDGAVLQKEAFCGTKGPRTLFFVRCKTAKDISLYSAYTTEKEVILPPGRLLQVEGICPSPSDKLLDMINLNEVSLPPGVKFVT